MTRSRPRQCPDCHKPIAQGDCPHVEFRYGQAIMSERGFNRLLAALDMAKAELDIYRNGETP
jgi:hypothetical protein